VITACNATLALQGAIETSEPSRNPWKVPSWTFVATPLAIKKAGKPFSFVDVDSETWRAIFSEDDENLVDVLPFGDDLDFERLRKKPLTNLVIDAAASFAALARPLPKSLHRFAIIFSLHTTKLLPAGEGAVMVTNCSEWATAFRSWTNFGFSTGRKSILFGTNAKLSEYAAAVALGSLDGFEEVKEKLLKIQSYAFNISNDLGLEPHPSMRKRLISPYWILDFKSKDQKLKAKFALEEYRIESRDWWEAGCHNEPIFSEQRVSLPKTDLIAANTLGLPMHTQLKKIELDEVKDVLRIFA